VLAAPMIPNINDHELERILEACVDAGATNAGYVLLRLPHELKELFTDWLHTNFPLRAEHVLSTVRSTRDGKLYDSRWGVRGRGTGPYAQLLEQRFDLACKRLGLNRKRHVLATDKFRAPPKAGDQLRLF
jgi:DNA repair photolyase